MAITGMYRIWLLVLLPCVNVVHNIKIIDEEFKISVFSIRKHAMR